MCYSQGDGCNTSLFKILYLCCIHGHFVVVVIVSVVSVWCVWLCSVVRSCATQDDANKDYVCTLTTSLEINRPPHLRSSRIYPELRDYETRLASKDPSSSQGLREKVSFVKFEEYDGEAGVGPLKAKRHRWEDSRSDETGRRRDLTNDTPEPAVRTLSTEVEATPKRVRS